MVLVLLTGLMGMVPCFSSDIKEAGGTASPAGAVFPDLHKIQTRGRLLVAQTGAESPPFSMIANEPSTGVSEAMRFALPDGQAVVGIDIAIANGIARALGVRLDLQRGHATSRSVIDAVSRGDADLGISHLAITSHRLQRVLFAAPYASFSSSLLIRRSCLPAPGAAPIKISPRSPLALSPGIPNCRVAVERLSIFEELFAVLFPTGAAVHYESAAELAQLLTTRSVDAALGDELTFRLQTQIHPELALYFALMEIPDHEERIAVAINPELPNLSAIADVVARHYTTNSTEHLFSTFAPLLESHLGAVPPSPTAPVLKALPGSPGLPSGHKQEVPPLRSEAFPLRAAAAVGLLLAAFIAAWLRMSRPLGSQPHDERAPT